MQLMVQEEKLSISVSDAIFKKKFNSALIHQVVTAYLVGSRQGSHAQKTKAEVSGSGKKPWRQKGTGRARAGSIRSPLWRSGGITFASKPTLYTQKINKKMYRGALRSIFSTLIQQNRLFVFKEFDILQPKTKLLLEKLNSISLHEAYIIINDINQNLFLASRNLYKVCVENVKFINPISLIKFKNVIVTVAAIKHIEAMLI
ncbi:50S ribosomal protein L4 [Buchnera aphidicola (Takecallis taiwana)]|uniref:50S ribosomal protein L4 n=1 Tax=Buchnera aphidicola TaxID=9 RepID=UPI0031B6A2EC